MRKKVRRKTILIDGIRYYDDKPDTCRKCFFWKNRKVGCVLGTQNCYYLAEAVKTEQEKKCEGCCYAKGHSCVSAVCYKELDAWLRAIRANRANRAKEEGATKAMPPQISGKVSTNAKADCQRPSSMFSSTSSMRCKKVKLALS